MHILTESVEHCLAQGLDIRLANTLCVVGICIPFCLEKGGLLLWLIRNPSGKHLTHVHSHNCGAHARILDPEAETQQQNYSTISQVDCSHDHRSPKLGHSRSLSPTHRRGHEHGHQHSWSQDKILCRGRSCSVGEEETTCVVPSITSVKLQNRVDILRTVLGAKPEDGLLLHADMIIADDCGPEVRLHNHLNFASNVLLIVLSIHSLIAGLTLGSIFNARTLSGLAPVLAFSLHKFFESLALGTTFFKREHPQLTRVDWFKILVYVCATPLGVLIGNVVQFDKLSELVLLSVTAGNFVYIALVEIIGEEFQSEQSRVTKFCCYMAGIIVASTIAWVAND